MLRINKFNVPLQLLTIVIVTFIYFYGTINNYFYGDDFIWLDRVRHLDGKWLRIFTVEHRYFTPLTYVSFFINYKLFGLNAFGYHLHDVFFHSLNGLLLYSLSYQISKNKLAPFLAAITFVTSSSMIITVLWPSARTDLMMVTFSLATIIAFIRKDSYKFKFFPISFYILALSAKGTALVIPFVLFLLTSNTKPLKNRIDEILPYITLNLVYVVFLIMSNFLGAANVIPKHNVLSLSNFFISFPTLIIPERPLAQFDIYVLATTSVIILIILLIINIKQRDLTLRIGTSLAVLGLLPIIFTNDYVLAGNNATALNLIGCPSNRVYLACAGISLVFAAIAVKALNSDMHFSFKIAFVILLTSLLYVNYREAGLINKIWSTGTKHTKTCMSLLDRNSSMLTDGSVLLLYNCEGSAGFLNGMIKAAYDLKKIEVHALFYRSVNEITDVDISPLQNPAFVYNPTNVKLIMNCRESPNEKLLTQYGNLALQDILSDYRILFETSTTVEETPIKWRLNNNMLRLRSLIDRCEIEG